MYRNVHVFAFNQEKHFRRIYSWLPEIDQGSEYYLIGNASDEMKRKYHSNNVKFLTEKQFIKCLLHSKKHFIIHGNMFRLLFLNSILFFLTLGYFKRCSWVCWGAGLNVETGGVKGTIKLMLKKALYTPLLSANFLMTPDKEKFSKIVAKKNLHVVPYLIESSNIVKKRNGFFNIFIGNQSSEHHNHIHFISELSRIPLPENFKVHLFMNYGSGDAEYIERVKDACSNMLPNRCVIYEDMLPYERYLELVSLCDVCILDTRHQTGLGLIYNCIRNGASIFLHKGGDNEKWLESIGIKTYNTCNMEDIIFLSDDFSSSNTQVFNNYFAKSNLVKQWKLFTESVTNNSNE